MPADIRRMVPGADVSFIGMTGLEVAPWDAGSRHPRARFVAGGAWWSELSPASTALDAGGGGVTTLQIVAICGFVEAQLLVKTTQTSFMSDVEGVFTSIPCQRHHCCRARLLVLAVPRNTQDPGLLDGTMATQFFERVLARGFL